MADVIDFTSRIKSSEPEPAGGPVVNEDILERCKMIYEQAQRGEITGIAMAIVHREPECSSSYIYEQGQQFRLGGALMWLFQRFGQKLAD